MSPDSAAEINTPGALPDGIIGKLQGILCLIHPFRRLSPGHDHWNSAGVYDTFKALPTIVDLDQIRTVGHQERARARQEVCVLLEKTERVAHRHHAKNGQIQLSRFPGHPG